MFLHQQEHSSRECGAIAWLGYDGKLAFMMEGGLPSGKPIVVSCQPPLEQPIGSRAWLIALNRCQRSEERGNIPLTYNSAGGHAGRLSEMTVYWVHASVVRRIDDKSTDRTNWQQ
jgi:hypothetical protein